VDSHHVDVAPDSTYQPDADSDFLFNADPDPTFTLMRIRIQIQTCKYKLKPLKSDKVGSYPHILACHLQTDADPDPDFYLRMRIQVAKMMRIHAGPDADPQQLKIIHIFYTEIKSS
jgi:hypothetical protein